MWNEPIMGLVAGGRTILPPGQNPRGGPGSGDTRWLRDLEPQRQATDRALNPDTGFAAQYADSFSHWRHLTNLSRPDNQWRIVRDIADVTGLRSGDAAWDNDINVAQRGNWSWNGAWAAAAQDGHHYHGGLVERLDVPVEQWPAQTPTFGSVRMTGIENPNTPVQRDSGPGQVHQSRRLLESLDGLVRSARLSPDHGRGGTARRGRAQSARVTHWPMGDSHSTQLLRPVRPGWGRP